MVIATQVLASAYYIWWLAQVVAIALLVVLALRWRPKFLNGTTVWGALTRALDARSARIADQLAAADRAREEAERIQAESRAEIERARGQAQEIVSRAEQTSQAIQRELVEKAQAEADRVVRQAGEEIDYERRQAVLALRRRAADIVIDAAGQVVREALTPESDRRIIDDSLKHLPEVE